MVYWDTRTREEPQIRDYAEIWQAANKVVLLDDLEDVSSARTRLERGVDPAPSAAEERRRPRHQRRRSRASRSRPSAGLVDECHLFLHPVTIGGGKPALPAGVRLELHDERRFESGVVFLSYRVV